MLRKTSLAFVALGIFGLGLGVSLLAGANAQKGSSARAALDQALNMATQWKSDAILVNVSSLAAREDGTATFGLSGWSYAFYSPKTKTWHSFTTRQEGLKGHDLAASLTARVDANFVDSDKIMAEARKNGFQPSGENMMTLGYLGAKGVKPGVYWLVANESGMSDWNNIKGFCLDPKTGRLLAKL